MQLIFEALASPVRRKILAYLAHTELNAGEIAARFAMSKPSISQHLAVLEEAGLVASEKRGKYVFYRQVEANIVNTLNGFVQEICPVGRPIRKESAALAERGRAKAESGEDAGEMPSPAKPAAMAD